MNGGKDVLKCNTMDSLWIRQIIKPIQLKPFGYVSVRHFALQQIKKVESDHTGNATFSITHEKSYPSDNMTSDVKYTYNQDNLDDAIDKDRLERNRRIGHAIEVLRYQLPRYFSYNSNHIASWHGNYERDYSTETEVDIAEEDFDQLNQLDMSIYHPDIVIREPHHYRLHLAGMKKYEWLMSATRSVLSVYCQQYQFKITNIVMHPRAESLGEFRAAPSSSSLGLSGGRGGQNSLNVSDSVGKVSVHWQFEGISRASIASHWLTSRLKSIGNLTGGNFNHSSPSSGEVGRLPPNQNIIDQKIIYNGVFVYRFMDDQRALIDEHSIEKVIPAPRKFAPLTLLGWLTSVGHWRTGKEVAVE
ncbi:hypothetical protein MIR68_012038 [Amoeboaphelidium protococcarum]|nr:hypothetical protein MIR68_012038 [Amoeboaphelidium protococcarum]